MSTFQPFFDITIYLFYNTSMTVYKVKYDYRYIVVLVTSYMRPRNEFVIVRHLLPFELGGTDPSLEPECVRAELCHQFWDMHLGIAGYKATPTPHRDLHPFWAVYAWNEHGLHSYIIAHARYRTDRGPCPLSRFVRVRLFWRVLSARVNRLSDGRKLTVSTGRLAQSLCPL